MTSTLLDLQLGRVLIAVLDIDSGKMIEPVVASIDVRRKIDMLKARARHISSEDWQKHLKKFLKTVEDVFEQRNIACHTPPAVNDGAWTFKPVEAAKLFKRIDFATKTVKPSSVEEFKKAIGIGQAAVGEGISIVRNFERVNAEKRRRDESAVRRRS